MFGVKDVLEKAVIRRLVLLRRLVGTLKIKVGSFTQSFELQGWKISWKRPIVCLAQRLQKFPRRGICVALFPLCQLVKRSKDLDRHRKDLLTVPDGFCFVFFFVVALSTSFAKSFCT